MNHLIVDILTAIHVMDNWQLSERVSTDQSPDYIAGLIVQLLVIDVLF